jgi:Spy/CpxP family protein refolding chaperone
VQSHSPARHPKIVPHRHVILLVISCPPGKPISRSSVQQTKPFTETLHDNTLKRRLTMRHLKSLALALLLAGLITTPGLAKPHCAGGPCYRDDAMQHIARIKEALSLTPEQEIEIRKILADSRAEMLARREDARANRAAVRTLLAAPSLDEPGLREALRKQSDLQADKLITRHAIQARISQVLTPEQQSTWEGLGKRRLERRERCDKPGT